MIMIDSEFAARYPEEKPVCFNYAAARVDVLALRGENLRLEKRLAVFEEFFNPDMARKFFALSETFSKSCTSCLTGRAEKTGTVHENRKVVRK